MHYSDINNLSSFLSRHASLFHGKRLLVCGQLQSVSLAPLISEPNTTFLISDYSVFNNLQTTTGTPKNPKLLYGFCLDTTEQRFDAVLLFIKCNLFASWRTCVSNGTIKVRLSIKSLHKPISTGELSLTIHLRNIQTLLHADVVFVGIIVSMPVFAE